MKSKELQGPPLKTKQIVVAIQLHFCIEDFSEKTFKNIHDIIIQNYMISQGVKKKYDDYLSCKIFSSIFEKSFE
jgi:hypothetical protein